MCTFVHRQMGWGEPAARLVGVLCGLRVKRVWQYLCWLQGGVSHRRVLRPVPADPKSAPTSGQWKRLHAFVRSVFASELLTHPESLLVASGAARLLCQVLAGCVQVTDCVLQRGWSRCVMHRQHLPRGAPQVIPRLPVLLVIAQGSWWVATCPCLLRPAWLHVSTPVSHPHPQATCSQPLLPAMQM